MPVACGASEGWRGMPNLSGNGVARWPSGESEKESVFTGAIVPRFGAAFQVMRHTNASVPRSGNAEGRSGADVIFGGRHPLDPTT
ncbi:hypothetical protein GCM10007350_26960 [Jeongeupia chitinilytica]|uniref:Uncharacterized protein n=1 Tax=Jeongeupia chitinilytica TaxID=1041641 RepID=A0ABQ3H3Y3_9NEIS|nr:hypothetical protein GCM10007350_26960 [Jeongeupia chitinilytica]